MNRQPRRSPHATAIASLLMLGCFGTLALGADAPETFDAMVKRLQAEKPAFAERQKNLLGERYDLADRPAAGVTMSRGKPVQDGVRARLPAGTSWEQLAGLSPAQIKERNLWPKGFYPLPHPHHEAGGMIFPQPHASVKPSAP